jgi:hypothetical protein
MKLSIVLVAALAIPAAAETPLSGNVLVWADAPLYPDPNATGPSIRVGTLDLGRDKDVGYVVPMRIVSTKDDVVEVEPTLDVECAPEGAADAVRIAISMSSRGTGRGAKSRTLRLSAIVRWR